MKEEEFLRLDNQLCFLLYAGSRAMTKLYRPVLEGMNLTYPQYLVMLVLWEHGTLSVSDIGSQLYLDSGTLTPLLKRLEASELITRTRLATDERKVMIRLTAKGLSLKQQAVTVPRELFCRSGLSVDEFLSLKNNLTVLLKRMNEAANHGSDCSESTDEALK